MPQLNFQFLKEDKSKNKSLAFLSPLLLWLESHHLIFLLFFSLFIRLLYLLLQNSLWWDSYVYIGMGKFFFSQGDAGLFELFRPPLFPLILGLFWKAGFNLLFISPLLDILFSMIAVILTYKIGTILFDKKTALLAALLTSINPIFLMHTGLILTEPLAMALGLSAVYLFIRNRSLFLVGLFLGLSVLAKFPQGIVFPAVILIIFLRPKSLLTKLRESAVVITGFILILLPYLVINQIYFDDPFLPFSAGTLLVTTATWLYGSGISYYFTHFFLMYPFFFLFFGYLFLLVKEEFEKRKDASGSISSRSFPSTKFSLSRFFLIIIIIGSIGYFLTVPRKEVRYLVAIVPYLSLFSVAMACQIYRWLQQQKKPALYPKSFALICFLLVFIFIPGQLSFADPAYPPEIKEQLATFRTDSPILSSNPSPAAFTDNKIIGLVNMEYAATVYQFQKEKSELLLLTDCDLVCPPGDLSCLQKKKELMQKIKAENQLLFHKIIKDCSTELYRIK